MWEGVKGETFPTWVIILIAGLVVLLAVAIVFYRKKDKIIDLIVEDFQNDGYLKGMSREEILDYYQKRLWLNKQRNPLPLKLDITG